MNTYEEFIDRIRSEFPGYHISIELFPSGGIIDAAGCEECKTDPSTMESISWKNERGRCRSLDEAVLLLKDKLSWIK